MRALLDTNVVIPLEDTERTLPPELAEMCRNASRAGVTLLIHPEQRADILRDRDETRQEIVLSRLERYQPIESPPRLSDEELAELGWRQANDNDRVDNLLLQALRRGAVNLLVTNDGGIHSKARAASLSDLVYRTPQFAALLQKLTSTVELSTPYGIEERFLYEFDVNQGFFDSLRDTYAGFNDWYLRVARDQRKAWCVAEDDTVLAICIYKLEDGLEVDTPDIEIPIGAALKLCTFKVGEAVRGRKLGERLLYAAFKYAHDQQIPHVYLHTRGEEQSLLVALCEEYGFTRIGSHEGDDAYHKRMQPDQAAASLDPLQYAIEFYPHYRKGEDVGKYIVPIEPRFHNELFADTSNTAQGLFANDPHMYGSPANTIKKAYLCHANLKTIKPGDILLFYRSRDRKSIECIGVVESCHRSSELAEVLPLVAKRTVYSREDLEGMLRRETLVILFRYMASLDPVFDDELEQFGVKGPIQTIRSITHEQFQKIIGEAT